MNGCNPRVRDDYRAGKANWDAFSFSMQDVERAAGEWSAELAGIERPWLCWNVDSDWCLVQQQLVKFAGWTPVVGFDPRAGQPKLIPGSVLIDFNRGFDFPALHMVFPLEFVFLFCDRLAFWHSDLLVDPVVLRDLADSFVLLKDGQTAAVDSRKTFLRRLKGEKARYWELIGCTTRQASDEQFQRGSGWWRHIEKHPNCPAGSIERWRRKKYNYDHGGGILYWERHYSGRVVRIKKELVEEGHCTGIGKPEYRRVSPIDERRDLSKELRLNYELYDVCRRLGITEVPGIEIPGKQSTSKGGTLGASRHADSSLKPC
jgi:hypothetical protein